MVEINRRIGEKISTSRGGTAGVSAPVCHSGPAPLHDLAGMTVHYIFIFLLCFPTAFLCKLLYHGASTETETPMDIKTLKDLYADLLRDMVSGEKQMIEALPKMAEAAETPELKQAFQNHLAETQGQLDRLEQIFTMLNMSSSGETCDAMKGLVKEGKKVIDHAKVEEVRDAGLIAAGQKVEHYEIGSYGTLVAMAKILGETKHAQLLEQTLNEEKAADQKLNQIAIGHVNKLAASASRDKKAA